MRHAGLSRAVALGEAPRLRGLLSCDGPLQYFDSLLSERPGRMPVREYPQAAYPDVGTVVGIFSVRRPRLLLTKGSFIVVLN